MPLLLRPTLAILPVSVLAPCLWLLVQSTRLSNYYAGGVLEPALLYGVLPALTLWLGSLPVALATWLLWRRISAWAITAFTVAVMPSLGLVLYAADVILPIPWGCYFNCPPGPGDVLRTSFAIAGVLAMLSLPVWIHLGILHLRGCLQLVIVGLLVAVATGTPCKFANSGTARCSRGQRKPGLHPRIVQICTARMDWPTPFRRSGGFGKSCWTWGAIPMTEVGQWRESTGLTPTLSKLLGELVGEYKNKAHPCPKIGGSNDK